MFLAVYSVLEAHNQISVAKILNPSPYYLRALRVLCGFNILAPESYRSATIARPVSRLCDGKHPALLAPRRSLPDRGASFFVFTLLGV